MTASEQYDYSLSLDDGAKVADSLVKTGFSSKTDAFLRQLCHIEAANDDAGADLFLREILLKKIMDAVVTVRKPLADEDKSKLFEYISEALEGQMKPLSVGLNDQALAVLIIENAQNPSAAQHNAQVLQLAQQLEESAAFFEMTAAKYVQFDNTQAAMLTERCLTLVQTQENPKGVVYALTLVNLGQVGMAMTILSALAEKGCATDMASFVHRLLPFVEGDDIENLLELLQQNLLQQQNVFEQPALYDHTARVYLQAVRSFADDGFYEQGEKIIEFLQQNQRLDGFEEDVTEVRRFVEEVKQKRLAEEQQDALLQAKVEAAKTAVAEAQAAAEAEAAESSVTEQEDNAPIIEAEVVPVETSENVTTEEESTAIEETVTTEENTAYTENVAPTGMVVDNAEPVVTDEDGASLNEQVSEEVGASEYQEQPVAEEGSVEYAEGMASEEVGASEYQEQLVAEEGSVEYAEGMASEEVEAGEYQEQPVAEEGSVEYTAEGFVQSEAGATVEDESGLSFEQRMAAAENESAGLSFEQRMAAAENESVGLSFEQRMAAAENEAMQEYAATEERQNLSFEQHMEVADDKAMQEYAASEEQNQTVEQPVNVAENEVPQEYATAEEEQNQIVEPQPAEAVETEVAQEPVAEAPVAEEPAEKVVESKSLRATLKSKLFGRKLDNVSEKVSNIKDNINNTLGINSDNLDKGLNIIKDVTTSAINIVGEQTVKVKQKVEDIVRTDENQNNIEANVGAEANLTEEVVSNVLTESAVISRNEPQVSETPMANATSPKPAAAPATPKKVVSTFYEVPFWERENAEELEQREQALKQQTYDEPSVEEQNTSASVANSFYAEENPFAGYENSENESTEADTQPTNNIFMSNRIEERIEERQEEQAEERAQEQAQAQEQENVETEQTNAKPNFDDIDLSEVSNYSSLDDFGYQIGEDSEDKK